MSDKDKAQAILAATSGGKDLPEHHWHVVMAALRGELGEATRIVFEDLWDQQQGEEGGR
ncbi:hypothetical protein [Desulfonatronum thioautotrophicum]|uniref:hypothetical protein n=1 Tax=Desulfonatronum thioautotrophicum TaxID=617001 RepID=UPI0012948181|nr:hypothetical protein [Desulfonatronum thioautotrophicum]